MYAPRKRLLWLVLGTLLVSANVGAAYADEQTPTIMGQSWVAIAIGVGLVLLLIAFIWAVLGISGRDKSEDDEAGVGILEGIDEDDDKPKKKRK